MTESHAYHLTIEILKIILEEHNGYTQEQIEADNMAIDCMYDTAALRIQEILENFNPGSEISVDKKVLRELQKKVDHLDAMHTVYGDTIWESVDPQFYID